MMDWNAWIGQEEPPLEEDYILPPLPPQISDELNAELEAKRSELWNRATVFRKESEGFKLPKAKNRSDFTPQEEKLKPELIKGLFRMNQKMIISGASKSGKSFMLIELALALASGTDWIGHPCKECKVLYVNLEIDGASFLNRIDNVAQIESIDRDIWDGNLKIMNLRGVHTNIREMRGALIAMILEEEAETGEPFGAVILDPIYKISNGEENSAKDVGEFCANLDVICRETGAAVIFSHHHSKGDQGYKSAQDRASGSGVFARDPDTMVDMIELDIDQETYLAMRGSFACRYWIRLLDENFPNWKDGVSEDSLEKSGDLAQIYQNKAHVTTKVLSYLNANIDDRFAESMKGTVPMRLEFTLREFATPEPINMFFRYPVHVLDEDGVLAAADPKMHIQGEKQSKAKASKKTKKEAFYEAVVSVISEQGFATYKDLMEKTKLSERSVKERVKELGDEFVTVTGGGKDKTKIYFREENESEKDDI